MPAKQDIIVIGGGVIGLACAWRLAQAGRQVTVLEKLVCGGGASGASLGALIPSAATHRGPQQRFQRESLIRFPAWAAELGDASGIDIGYLRTGRLEILPTDQRRRMAETEVRMAVAEWLWAGPEPVMEVLDAAQARALEPAVSCDEFGAVLCRSSAQVAVDRLLEALQAACRAGGAQILEDHAVTGLELADGRVRGVICRGRIWPAEVVLVCAGVWTGQIADVLRHATRITPAKGQALMLQTPPEQPTPVAHIIKRKTAYLIPRADGTIMVGSTTEPEAGFDERSTAGGVATLAGGVLALVPGLEAATLVRAWAGPRPESADGKPFIGAVPEVGGLYVAAGHYKTGVGLAPLSSTVICDLINRGTTEFDVSSFRPARIEAAP